MEVEEQLYTFKKMNKKIKFNQDGKEKQSRHILTNVNNEKKNIIINLVAFQNYNSIFTFFFFLET